MWFAGICPVSNCMLPPSLTPGYVTAPTIHWHAHCSFRDNYSQHSGLTARHLWRRCLTQMGTQKETFVELTERIGRKTGGLSV